MAYIYLITNTLNGKQYVGKTLYSIQTRWNQHKKDCCRPRINKRPLYDAFNKYGIENFKIELIEECDADSVDEREEYWIANLDTYSNGYNATLGGDGKHYKNYQEIAEKYKELQNQKKTAQFFNCDVETVRVACRECGVTILSSSEVRISERNIIIQQVDKDTNEVINEYHSFIEAARAIGVMRGTHIGDVVRGKRKTAYGYKWRIKE